MKRPRTTAARSRQQGAVLVTVALLLLFLLGFIGFAIDIGRLFIVRNELQTALDSCALAAAQELDGQSTSITRAITAGTTAGNINRVNLQSANWDTKGQLTAGSFEFRDTNYNVTVTAPAARYVECRHTQSDVRLWLLQAMGAFFGDAQAFPSSQSVATRAVATRASAQSTCPIPLLLRPKSAGAGAPNYGYTRGDWVTLLTGGGSGSNGYIGWANLDGSNSASETERELLQGECEVRLNDDLGTPGVQASIADAWNARFGIYKNNAGPSTPFMQPDRTGYVYTAANWPTQREAYDGATPAGAHATAANFVTKRDSYASCADTTTRMTGNDSCASITGLTIGGGFTNLILPGADIKGGHAEYGLSKRLVLVPVSNTYPGRVQDYACMLMLQPMTIPMSNVQLEFIGNAGEVNSPCTTSGLPGGTAGPLVPVLVR